MRQGATLLEVGLLNASPAIVNLLFALPAGYWLQARAVGRSVFWLSIGHRLFYLLLALLPSDRRPVGLAWYNIALHGAMLAGSLLGPLLAGLVFWRATGKVARPVHSGAQPLEKALLAGGTVSRRR